MSINPDDFPAPRVGFVITNFLVVSDQDRSREFYRSLFDGVVLLERDPVIMKVANTWLILNEGGGPTDDKPTVTLTTPPEKSREIAQQIPGAQLVMIPDAAHIANVEQPEIVTNLILDHVQ